MGTKPWSVYNCYSSDDLLNWFDEGIVLEVDKDNSDSDITQGCIMERPKVIYNKITKKFVMWFHLEMNKQDKNFINKIDETKAFVRRGGFALFLKVTGTLYTWGAPNLQPRPEDAGDDWRRMVPRVLQNMETDKLPYDANMYATNGNYISRNHIVTNHAIFKDLPVNTLMSGVYENVCAEVSICRPAEGKYLVGVITYDQNKNMDNMQRHYNGIGDVLCAAAVLLVESGKGKMIFSSLKILENLGKDPVADKLLCNMIQFGLDQ